MSVEDAVVVPVPVKADKVKDKKEKKERKEKKKDKKDKKEKKEKKARSDDVTTEDTPAESTPVENESGAVTEEPEKAKKKKDKKDKKDKKKAKKLKEVSSATPGEDNDVEMAEAPPQEADKKEKKKSKKRKHQDLAEDTPAATPETPATETTEPEPKPKKKKKNSDKESAQNGAAATNGTANGAKSSDGSYTQSDALDAVPQSEIDDFFKANHITTTDPTEAHSHLRPVTAFAHLPQTKLLSRDPFKAYKAPTPIQAASWPFTLSGRDVIGVAETGSGKTMAFALPCVEALSAGGKARAVRAFVVSPTRELAMQTHEQMAQLASLVGLTCVCVYGGAPKHEQRSLLDRGADIIVATPGRLRDFMNEGVIDLSAARFAVLDEADRMLDTGFEEDIRQILAAAPPRGQRQTLMFTATWPASVQALASTFMVDPVKITISSASTGDKAGELQANARIAQRVEVLEPFAKEGRLLDILRNYARGDKRADRILVFCLYKKEATRVEEVLSRRSGLKVAGIHGDLRQEQRTRSLEAFKTGGVSVLVATDVAARGLDIPEVKLVINMTFPLTIEDYVHRIGRTGRAGKTGEAITFFTQHDKTHSGSLVNILRQAGQPVPEDLLKFGTTVKKKLHPVYGAFYREVNTTDVPKNITFDD